MKLHEYESKSVFSKYNLPIPNGKIAEDSQQAFTVAVDLGAAMAVKAQVLVAGRGKVGGILFAANPEQAEEAAQKLLGSQVKGELVTKVLVEESIPLKRELYFGITLDRLSRCYVAVASETGGANIEEMAEKQPQKIHKKQIDPQLGFRSYHARQIANEMGYDGDKLLELSEILQILFRLGLDLDAELVEVNPLVETLAGHFVAVDARLILDDNALFRHKDYQQKQLLEKRDLKVQEFEALKAGLDYVELDGDVGVIGNGAGLVMATMDMISLNGGRPANFLDLGGGASPQRVTTAVNLVSSNPKVKVLFVNVLGGITLCDEVARGIILARQQLKSSKPMVVRLLGANEIEGKRILAEAGFYVFDSMEEAAIQAVELSKKGS